MDRKEKILRELGLEGLLHCEYAHEVELYDVKKGVVEDMYGYSEGGIWYIVEGWVRGNSYFGSSADLSWSLKKGQWFGFSESILGSNSEYDLEAMTDCVILEIPMKKLYEDPNLDLNLFKKLVWYMALTKQEAAETAITRLGFSDEGYFMKYLEESGFTISYRSQQELAEVLNIHVRTFQRILRILKDKGIITMERGSLQVIDREKFYLYAEENGVWDKK